MNMKRPKILPSLQCAMESGKRCIQAGADMLVAGAKSIFQPGEGVEEQYIRFSRYLAMTTSGGG